MNFSSGTYSSQKVMINQTRLFTKAGEIKDAKIIYDFIKQSSIANNYFISNIDSLINVKDQIVVVFLPNNQASINISNNSKRVNVVRVKNHIYLESRDTSSVLNNYNQSFGIKPFFYSVVTYSPLYSETFPLPSGTEYLSLTKTKLCSYLEMEENEIIYPLISFSYFHHITKYDRSIEAYKNYNNTFNENCIQNLGELDTLAVQQLEVILIKK